MNLNVTNYLKNLKKWKDESGSLRDIILECGLTEEFKWGKPCYSFDKNNIVIIQGFKDYCALLFFKGVLLIDPNGQLIKTGEHTDVGRQIRFTNIDEIVKLKSIIKKYLKEAIEIEKAGLKIDSSHKKVLVYPIEFENKLSSNPALKLAFDSLSPGRKKGYHIYFSSAKQSKTRQDRIDKYIPKILLGKGYNDR